METVAAVIATYAEDKIRLDQPAKLASKAELRYAFGTFRTHPYRVQTIAKSPPEKTGRRDRPVFEPPAGEA
jgi:hypothetical protein